MRLWQFCEALNIDVASVFRDPSIAPAKAVNREAQPLRGVMDAGVGWTDAPGCAPPIEAKGALVQRIGAAARELSEARQRTALAVIRALKAEEAD